MTTNLTPISSNNLFIKIVKKTVDENFFDHKLLHGFEITPNQFFVLTYKCVLVMVFDTTSNHLNLGRLNIEIEGRLG